MIAAERVLYAISPDGIGQDLVLTVDAPVETKDRGWNCKVSIGFIGPTLTIAGMDAWQAIQESMLFVAKRVGHQEESGWKFYWEKDGDRMYAVDLAADPEMPRRERTSDFEASTEEVPFTPEQNATFRQIALDRAPDQLLKLENSNSEQDVFAHIANAAAAAFHLDRFEDARKFADQALAMAPAFKSNWNYGNAIHRGHTVLGLLALRQGNLLEAIEELLKSGETPGSPQLNSFGPTMHLAKAILLKDQPEPVLAYLNQCRKFWKMGDTWLDIWSKIILAGRVPNFFQHSYA